MPKFITHEPLANNWFNMNHTTGSGHLQPWATPLTNREDVLLLLVDRMEKDYLALSPKMRKAYGKDVEALQRVCAAFLAAKERYQELVPAAFFERTMQDIKNALSKQLLDATWGQTELNFQQDLQKLSNWAQTFDLFSQQQAMMDFKYLNDRYVKGKERVETLLLEKHKLLAHESLIMGLSPIVEMQEQLGSDGLTVLIFDCTLWPQRAMAVDEAVQICQSVSSGNPRTVCWFMLPQWHSSTAKCTVLKNRRLVEDKVVACMDVYEVAVNFADSAHGGLAAMVSQGASNTNVWAKSRALLGSISGVERARVNELVNPEPEKPLAPHWRVQQRGVAATKSVLLQLLDGMTSGLNFPVLVVDLLPSRFCEWSSACWEIQKDNLLGTNLDLDLRFLALYHNDDSVHLTSAKECLVGRAMGQWWDRSNEAGPRSRENTRIADMVAEKFKDTHSDSLKKMTDELEEQQVIQTALKGVGNPSATPGTSEGQQCPRTSASPEWCGDFPWNFRKRMSHTGISIADFEGGNSVDACAVLAREPQLRVCFTTLGNMWILNKGDAAVTLSAGELFGFNLGSYVEIPTATAAAATDSLPWCLGDDKSLVSLVKTENGQTTKVISSVAELMCNITKERGITEMRLVDHDMQPMLKARSLTNRF
ncbi:unnamed protein product [Cladocopium goreaui]|uniref:Uncharacterized protein n=1 Tax=Cladocopium goreaui TaxID=2562237 RepID=A0A9P1BPQ6_9DINO|nr:unnamed protein product [Cladocopium goreaui]